MSREFKSRRLKKKYYKKRKFKKSIKILFLFIFLMFSFIIFLNYNNYSLNNLFYNRDEEIQIELKNKENIHVITDKLYDNKLISNKIMFRILAKLNNLEHIDKKYVFSFKRNSNMFDIIKKLKECGNYDYKIILYDGESIEKLVDIFSEKDSDKKNTIMRNINNIIYINTLMQKYDFLPEEIKSDNLKYKLEGFIYPGEYLLNNSDKIEDVLEIGLSRFQEAYISNSIEEKIKQKNIKLFDLVRMSTVVRGEVPVDDIENQKKVAGVFYNRLEKGMKLQSDFTVAYAINKNKRNYTKEELSIPSNYNTYHIQGLPIGPVGNTNASLFESILEYTKSNYLYFLTDIYNKNNDELEKFYYAENYEQHKINTEKYLTCKRREQKS